ncbi:TM2 domain-containing protein [Campylobacter pinnipediorum]|uniref:TM2 domain-containing protein n=1 Tax=Campylobacter pinnipediorum TaxID=1965231 RepID=UPI00084DCE60|nr:TM2 domain-containing protein [Campylobacter pinnipediorum]
MDELFSSLKDKIPKYSHDNIKKRIDCVSSETLNMVPMLKIKNPIAGFWLSVFFGFLGVDRFYRGQFINGISKAIAGIFSIYGMVIFSDFLDNLPSDPLLFVIYPIFLFQFICIGMIPIFCIHYVFDIFLVYRGIKKDNLQKIKMLL